MQFPLLSLCSEVEERAFAKRFISYWFSGEDTEIVKVKKTSKKRKKNNARERKRKRFVISAVYYISIILHINFSFNIFL